MPVLGHFDKSDSVETLDLRSELKTGLPKEFVYLLPTLSSADFIEHPR